MSARKCQKNDYKRPSLFLLSLLLLILFLIPNPMDGYVQNKNLELFTVEQIKKMMRYHGTLVAKFDGRHWRFLSGNYWIKLDNANAVEYAKAESYGDTQS